MRPSGGLNAARAPGTTAEATIAPPAPAHPANAGENPMTIRTATPKNAVTATRPGPPDICRMAADQAAQQARKTKGATIICRIATEGTMVTTTAAGRRRASAARRRHPPGAIHPEGPKAARTARAIQRPSADPSNPSAVIAPTRRVNAPGVAQAAQRNAVMIREYTEANSYQLSALSKRPRNPPRTQTQKHNISQRSPSTRRRRKIPPSVLCGRIAPVFLSAPLRLCVLFFQRHDARSESPAPAQLPSGGSPPGAARWTMTPCRA